MQSDNDTEAGHILTHLSSGSSYPGHIPIQQNQQLTPSSSAPGVSPAQQLAESPRANQNLSLGENGTNGNGSGVKRSRQRPTKSCEECRRKKLKCDRELPCSNCKKGGRDGGTCFFKDAPGTGDFGGGKRLRTEELESGWRDRERRPYVGVGDYGNGEVEREERNYYPNVPPLARSDPIGPGRGVLAYGIGMDGVDGHQADAIRARIFQQEEDRKRILGGGNAEVYPNVPDLARERNIGFGRAMFTYGVNDVPPEASRDEIPTPTSSAGIAQNESVRALGRVHIRGTRSRYVGIGDRMAMLDHVSHAPPLWFLANDVVRRLERFHSEELQRSRDVGCNP